MAYETLSHHGLRTTLPALVLITLIATGLGAGYYFGAVATASTPFQVTWSVRPLKIKFSVVNSFSGSANDSFTCNPAVAPVTLKAASAQPDNITLTVSPSSFSSCGSTTDNVLVTATCTSQAIANFGCGDIETTGTVVVCGPTSYTCLKQALAVSITTTTRP